MFHLLSIKHAVQLTFLSLKVDPIFRSEAKGLLGPRSATPDPEGMKFKVAMA